MSLFPEYEITVRWYQFTDSNTTKIADVDFGSDAYTEIEMNIIRSGDIDAIIEGEILGEFKANVTQSGITRGDLIYISATSVYSVVRNPRYNKLFSKYHLNLKIAE